MKMRKAGYLLAGLGTVSIAAMAVALSSTAAPTTSATEKVLGSKVDNFMLADQTGLGHELYYFKDRKAIVLASVVLGDKTSERALAELAKLKAAHDDKQVKVYAIDSAAADTRETIAAKYPNNNDLPILDDELQLVGRALGVTTTSEAFVIDPKTWKVVYHGPIDKSFAAKSGGKGSVAAAVDALVSGAAPEPIEAAVKGAKVDFPARKQDFTKISYAKDVAPIIGAKCVTCHVEGGMGPFKMDRYETVKGFSPMIREVLRTNRMPPFHSDNHGMKWSNEMRLTDAEKLKVVNWIEAGSPRGEGEDPLPKLQQKPPTWPLGQPDEIVTIPDFQVPASGIIDYQERSIPTKFSGEGRWLKATAWTGASAAVHHALAGWIPEVRADGKGFSWNTSLGGYGPGGEANLTPADTGIWVPSGGSYAYQMHYTSTGKPITDKTQVGYYFYKDPPKYILRQASVTDFSIEIPAGAERWHETAYLEFPHDALIFGTQPHCHSRCYATKLRIRYPDGKEKLILNQARYEFSWQREYLFEPMLEVPAGSLLIADYIFDNSVNNASNPDPKKNVTFGEQTSEEMLFTFARFRWKDETVENRHDDWMKELQQNVTFGAFDDNIDGKITPAEIRNDPRFSPLKQYIGVVDKDKDGALSKVEFKSALQMMSNMRRPAPKTDKAVEEMTNGGSGNAPAAAPKKAN